MTKTKHVKGRGNLPTSVETNASNPEPGIYEVRTPTGISLNYVSSNHNSAYGQHVNTAYTRIKEFLPVAFRTTPSLTLDDPNVQAFLEALEKKRCDICEK
jgi:hypothetical protein